MGLFSTLSLNNYLKYFLGFLWILLLMVNDGLTQRPPYSLQSAVDELHLRGAAKYPLNAPPPQRQFFGGFGVSPDLDYWDDDSNYPANTNYKKLQNRHKFNKALTKFLERENYEADHGGLALGPFGGYEFDADNNNFLTDEKKRSFFRERDNRYDNIPGSIFRERETPPSSGSELTEEFLREIEEAQEREREQHYTDALRQLFDKYQQQQENEVGGNELFEEKKRMRMPPYYMLMQKKRSYPILPYLPYDDRKKRFPVSKRSTKRSSTNAINIGKTDERVERELSELFGNHRNNEEEKKKRSVEESTAKPSTTSNSGSLENSSTSGLPVSSEAPPKSETKKDENDSGQMAVDTHGNEMHHKGRAGLHSGHSIKEHKHRKRSNHQHSHENNEEASEEHEEDDEEEDEEGDHDEDHEDEHDEAEGEEEDDEERKKKRDVSALKGAKEQVVKNSQNAPKDLAQIRRKKSIQWSKYFGIDRKKKAQRSLDVKKRSTYDDDSEMDEVLKRQDLDPEKIENMDRKLQSLEDYIIDDTIKYTGAHEGIATQADIRRLKDHVLSRLATAYSLEKMRRALEKLRQSVENENHLGRNIIESSFDSISSKSDKIDSQKRLSVKKETSNEAPSDLSSIPEKSKEIHSNAMMDPALESHAKERNRNNNDDLEEEMKKKQKKRNSYLRYPNVPNDFRDSEDDVVNGNFESLNDAYLGNKNYIIGSNQCPIIESMHDRCQGLDLLSGDLNQELLPTCGVHQICYLCGTSQLICDFQYLAEVEAICGDSNECQAAARSILMSLRQSPGIHLGPRECVKNPCLYSAMREIGL